jgi:hypothetical protein
LQVVLVMLQLELVAAVVVHLKLVIQMQVVTAVMVLQTL